MLQIRLLGQFDVRLDGRRVLIPSRAGQSLLAYLALTAGTAHRREKLAGIFWSDSTDESARGYLRHALWQIRKAISSQEPAASPFLLADEFTICFNSQADYWLDAAQLERTEADLQSLSSNLALYQGELLPGFYEDWVVLERQRVQSLFDAKMEELVTQLIAAERWVAVQEQSERWLSLGSTVEPAYRALMLAYGARGDMAKVSSLYQRCMDVLDEQFGLEPSAETRALYDGLLKGAKPPARPSLQPSSTVTFLFTDIEGSTQLLDQLGEQYAAVLAEHHEILRLAIEKWNGREVDRQGDAFFVTFPRALDAVQFAAEAQRLLASHAWPQGQSVRVRMGLHTGEPLLTSVGYVGMDVHRAARIGDAAHGGQVLLSQTTRELVAQDLPRGMAIRDLGEHRLKDLKFPTPIYQLVIEGVQNDFPPIRTKFTGAEIPTPGEPPFKGLQFFDEIDSDLFFGRELLTAKLVSPLNEGGFLSVIVGASGSGKSSLVRAGLIPALKKRQALMDGTMPPEGSEGWRVHVIVPTAHPLQALALELTRDSESVSAAATLMDDLLQDPRSLALYLARQAPNQHVLLVLDQFEELFTLCRDEFEREAFIDNLLTAVLPSPEAAGGRDPQDHGQVTLVLTLRADFYAHLAQYPELRDAVAHRQEYIGPMTAEELRRAIEEPAKRGNWAFEPGLVDLLLRDVGDEPGALPLLSHALLETWKRRAGHTLTLKGYADAGGVRGAIAHTAESVYQSLSPDQQAMARDIFLRLTELGEGTEDTRRRASFDELVSHAEDPEETRSVLNRLAEARLVTLGQDTAEVAHEALIRGWPTLREWLAQDRESLRLHRRLTEAAHEWELLERDAGALYRGSHLAQAREWAAVHPISLNAGEQAFLDASNALEQRETKEREAQQQRELEAAQNLARVRQTANQRLRRRALLLAGALGIALLMTFSALFLGERAQQNAVAAQAADHQSAASAATAQAEAQGLATQQVISQADFNLSEAQRLALEANNLMLNNGDPSLIALLAIRSLSKQYISTGDAVLSNLTSLEAPPTVLSGHTDTIYSVAFSPDGRFLAAASLDKTARLWDVTTGKLIRIFTGNPVGVDGLEFSPDGKTLAADFDDGTVRLWDVDSGQTLKMFSLPGAAPPMGYVVFSPDGKNIAVTSGGLTVPILDVATGKTVQALTGSTTGYTRLAYSPDGKYVIAGVDQAQGALMWDTTTGKQVHVFPGPGWCTSVAFTPDGRYIALGNEGPDTIRLYDAVSLQLVREFVGHRAGEQVSGIVFTPDGKEMVSVGSDGLARLWEVATGQFVHYIGSRGGAEDDVAISRDGRLLAITGNRDNGFAISVWNLKNTLGGVQFVGHAGAVYQASFSPDGRFVVTASLDHTARIWDAATGQSLITVSAGHDDAGELEGAVFSPDGKSILTTGRDGTARLWDATSGNELRRFQGHTDVAYRAAFSPDSKYAVTTSYDGTARVWDTQTGQTILIYRNQSPKHLNRVAFSPDGKTVVTSGDDGTARIWDLLTGRDLMVFKHDVGVTGVAFSPDGNELVTGSYDGIVRLWDVKTGQQLRQFVGHTGSVFGVAFSPDGKFVASSGEDATARLWDVQSGQEVRRFIGHAGEIRSVAFSPDGKYILTASQDGTARIWLVDLHDTIRAVCSLLARDFSAQERTQFGIRDTAPTCPKP